MNACVCGLYLLCLASSERIYPSQFKLTKSGNLIFDTRYRIHTTSKPNTAPRSCTSLDTPDGPVDQKQCEPPVIRRQGSSTDGEAIKIVIDDVDSTSAKDNNKGQPTEVSELRTRVYRLRRDPQDRGYQSKFFNCI